MLNRRYFLKSAGLLGANMLLFKPGNTAMNTANWHMPDESARHKRTWMAFGASASIWGHQLLPEVQRNLAMIANTIVQYEPVFMLVRPAEFAQAATLLDKAVELIECPLDDLWMRDTGPTFVISNDGQKAAVDFNFNGWGEKQTYQRDAAVASFIAQMAKVPVIHTDLVLEGGCIEVDGAGTAVITESCVLNNNRNPGLSKAQFEDQLMPLLGLDKIIWLPGIKGKDITDGHTDFYARFVRPGLIAAGYEPDTEAYDHEVTQRHLDMLQNAIDAQGRKLEVLVLEAPTDSRPRYNKDTFAAGYMGYYVCNDAVIMQNFGDKVADQAAIDTLQQAFPGRIIESIAVDGIAAGGGSIHCATQQEPID